MHVGCPGNVHQLLVKTFPVFITSGFRYLRFKYMLPLTFDVLDFFFCQRGVVMSLYAHALLARGLSSVVDLSRHVEFRLFVLSGTYDIALG